MKEMEMKRVPKLRFPEFTDDWEQRKFSDITFPAGEKNKDNLPLESYSITNERGFVPQDEKFENGGTMREADKRMYYIVSPNSFAYNPARINVGSIGYQNVGKNVIVSSLYEVFKTSEDVDDRLLWHWFKSPDFQKLIMQLQEGGVRLYFYYDKLCMGEVSLPSLEEQRKIGKLFDTIDNLITLHQRKLEKLKELKKGLVQKLFSQEVRFKADDGSEFPKWEEKRLSGLFGKVIEKNRLDLPALTIIQGYGTIRRDESERKITYDEKGLKNYKAVQKDDFIVHLRSFEGGLEIANQDGIVSPAYHVYRGNDEVHPLFYYPYFRSSSFIKGKLAVCVTGVRDGKNIEMGAFDELLIPHPCLAEQQKIAECLSALDDVIEKQKATLAAWEELKKGLLQQMFV